MIFMLIYSNYNTSTAVVVFPSESNRMIFVVNRLIQYFQEFNDVVGVASSGGYPQLKITAFLLIPFMI